MVISVRPWAVVLASRGGAFCVVYESAVEACAWDGGAHAVMAPGTAVPYSMLFEGAVRTGRELVCLTQL